MRMVVERVSLDGCGLSLEDIYFCVTAFQKLMSLCVSFEECRF